MLLNQMQWQIKPGWWHFTGVGGVTTGQLAVALAAQGKTVTGSDENIFEPMKSYLSEHAGVKLRISYNFRNLIYSTYSLDSADEFLIPEVIVAQGALAENHKELLFAHKRGIPILNFAQVLEQQLIVKNKSIVVAGSFGKTTTTALLVKILQAAGKPLSYMIGAIVPDFDTGIQLKTETTEYSVIEGDEYISSRSDYQSKFFHYHPQYLLLSGYAYDHTDVFATTEEYYANFQKLIMQLPTTAVVVYNAKYPELEKLAGQASGKIIAYKLDSELGDAVGQMPAQLLGSFNRENILGAVTMALELGVSMAVCQQTIAEFKGPKRRLEKVWEGFLPKTGALLQIIDDFGASPAKAKASLEALRAEFPEANIVAVFEPNIGNRTMAALGEYNQAFANANSLLLPKFSHITQQGVISEQEIYDYLSKATNVNVIIENGTKAELAKHCLHLVDAGKQNILIFLSSHSIDEVLTEIKVQLS